MNSLKNRWEETGQKKNICLVYFTLHPRFTADKHYCPYYGWMNSFTWEGNQWIKALDLNYPTVLSVIQVVTENAHQF